MSKKPADSLFWELGYKKISDCGHHAIYEKSEWDGEKSWMHRVTVYADRSKFWREDAFKNAEQKSFAVNTRLMNACVKKTYEIKKYLQRRHGHEED